MKTDVKDLFYSIINLKALIDQDKHMTTELQMILFM